jgi:hypothetical protein
MARAMPIPFTAARATWACRAPRAAPRQRGLVVLAGKLAALSLRGGGVLLGALLGCPAPLLVLSLALLGYDALEVLGVAKDVVALALRSVLPGSPLEQRALFGRRRRVCGVCGVCHDCAACIGCVCVVLGRSCH